MSNNNMSEAMAWLADNAPEWRLQRADTTLQAAPYVGGPTARHVQVMLVPTATEWPREPDVLVTGEGGTIVEAVQAAIGAARQSEPIA